MKKVLVLLSITGLLIFLFQSFIFKPEAGSYFPDDIKVVLKTSCYDCHSNDASNDKSKGALNFDQWSDYKSTKMISKLDDIQEVVVEDKMPPEKYLKKYPEKALTDDVKTLVSSWVEEELEKLMEGR